MTGQIKSPNHVALRAFEAVLRLGGLSAAARDMGVTPAAISHRLRDLEAAAGTALLRREGGRFIATEAGQVIAASLGDAFLRIRRADAALQGLHARPQIRIVAPMSFTVLWMLPRLAGFEAAHPEVTPYISAASDPLRRDSEADIRICHGTAPPPGSWVLLVQDATAVVAAPGAGLPADLAAVLAQRVIHIDTPLGMAGGTFGWRDWARTLRIAAPMPTGPHVNAEHVAADLAMQGKGLMLASLFTLADAILAGRLVVMPGSAVQTGIGYWMQMESTGPVARAFAAWLSNTVAQHERTEMARITTGLAGLNAVAAEGG